jgi:hypothetical protein
MLGARPPDEGIDRDVGADHLLRAERWNGLRPGDPVRVADLPIRGASWQFRAHVRNVRNGHEFVEVVGGRDGDRTLRSFAPERIFPVGSRRSANGRAGTPLPSLVDAPQLPF